ncbi:tetratricopeptide repeat protein [Hymenobacter sp.]|jgi:tetratricopeptide (TPR) repeat protein|uniref:tetratricopeptide repeat protein n=1 Tax=Hymenobacter sp. TaxID=1898978 RepID=UPI002ED8307E
MASCGQTVTKQPLAAECSRKTYRDSLITRYIERGAEKVSYLDPRWNQYCDSLIAICPNIGVAYQHKAVPPVKDGKWEEAFALEDKAVEVDPQAWLAYRGFLKVIKTKDYEGGLADFQLAARRNANGREMDHTFPFFEGLCHLKMGQYALAEQDFKRDMALQKSSIAEADIHFNSLFYVGVLYWKMGKYALSEQYLQQCLKQYAQHPDANYYLGLTHRAQKRETEARQRLTFAQQCLAKGYQMNEDNTFYENYPYQITTYEVQQALLR